MAEEIKQEVEENAVEELLNGIENSIPGIGGENGTQELAMLFNLPDEQFKVLAPVFLDEMEKAFDDKTQQATIMLALQAEGIKIEDIVNEYHALNEQIETVLKGQMSEPKIEFLKNMVFLVINSLQKVQDIEDQVYCVPIQLDDNAFMPEYKHVGDAGADLRTPIDFKLGPGEKTIVKLGFKMKIPKGYAVLIQPRSGLSAKTKFRVQLGLVDSSYLGEIGVICENIDPFIRSADVKTENGKVELDNIAFGSEIEFSRGDRIAQMRLVQAPTMSFQKVNHLGEESDRGEGGFGSTGVS